MPAAWPAGADGFASFQADTPARRAALEAVWSWAVNVTRYSRAAYERQFDLSVEAVPPAALVLWGGYGAGKTHLARAADRLLLSAGHVGNFFDAPAWLKRIQSFYSREASGDAQLRAYADWLRRPYFILDDLGTEHVREESLPWLRECLFGLVNPADAGAGPCLLITTNLAPFVVRGADNVELGPLAERVGGKVWSRLAGLCGEAGFVDMSAIPDYRMAVN